jgi:hypothetical protein
MCAHTHNTHTHTLSLSLCARGPLANEQNPESEFNQSALFRLTKDITQHKPFKRAQVFWGGVGGNSGVCEGGGEKEDFGWSGVCV